MTKLAKKVKAARALVEREKEYSLTEALDILVKCEGAKFDETVDIALNLNVDPRHADQQVRSSIVLPNGTGKTVRIAVFAKGEKAEEAKKAGADIVGDEDLAKKIQGGFFDFDRVVAAPDCMPIVGTLGKVLGPKGLMPNPKLGTVTPNVANAIKEIKSGMVEYRCEKNGILHSMAGKKSFGAEKLVQNISAFINKIKSEKPSGVKGVFIRRLVVSSTMGPGIKIDLGSIE